MELSSTTKTRARKAGWSDQLIERLEGSTATNEQVENLAMGKMPAERVDAWIDFLERDPENPFTAAKFQIFRTPAETGVAATPGPDGLRLRDINIGSYGVVPDQWGPAQRRPARHHLHRADHGGGLLDLRQGGGLVGERGRPL